MAGFGGTVKLTGETAYKKALAEIAGNLKVLNSQMRLVTSAYDKNDNSTAKLNKQNDVLNKKIAEQQDKLSILKQALSEAEQETGKNSRTSQKWQIELNNAQAELNKLNRELSTNSERLAEAKAKEESFANQSKYTVNGIKDLAVEMLKGVAGVSNFGKTIKTDLTERINDAKDKVNNTRESVKEFGASVSDTIKHPTKLGEAIKGKLVDAVEKLEKSTDESADALENFGKEADKSGESVLKLGDIIKASLISDAIKTGIKGLVSAVKSVGSAFLDVGKQAIESYGEYEQLVGGVDTLFGKSSQKVQEYAKVAYKTAGLSANEYMNTVTSFSASLLQSLGGDTEKATDVANMAIIDMSDNANKMGTDMQSIQNAYQGFAKQNYTMLDNLKLGYGGTATEMARLINDSGVLGDKVIDLSKKTEIGAQLQEVGYAKMIEAIHVVQTEMKITGTTAAEADATIQGSVNSMKAAWENLVTGIADDNANFEQLVDNLVVSIVGNDGGGGIIGNILPRVEIAINGIGQLVVSLGDKLLPQVIQIASGLIGNIIDTLNTNIGVVISAGENIIQTLVDAIMEHSEDLINLGIKLVHWLTMTILENLPTLIQTGAELLTSLIQGITDITPELIPTAIDCIVQIVETLLDNIDMIIDAGIELILALAEGLLDALPDLVDKIPIIIDKLINAITNNLPKIVEMGIELTIKLAVGIIKAIPQLVAKIPQIITSLVNGLKGGLGKLEDVGKNLVKGIWDGISGSLQWIKDKITGWVGNVTGFIKRLFGINSPSKVFKEQIGTNLALGIGEGFSETMKGVNKEMANAIPTEFDAEIHSNISGVGTTLSNYDNMVYAFKQALRDVKVVMNNREMGAFVTDTVTREVFAQ